MAAAMPPGFLRALISIFATLFAAGAFAQGYPAKPVRVIVPFPPGGSADVVGRLMPHAYKAVRVGSMEDAAHAAEFPGEHLLVDAKVPGKLGGTGRVLDWALVEPLARRRKLTIAGGLTADNVLDAIAAVRPFCVDVASGVEIKGNPRKKDRAKLFTAS